METYYTDSDKATEELGARLAKTLSPGAFIALYGDLGAGKTAFVRGSVSYLSPSACACSPTYAIVNDYGGKIPVYHFDLYRVCDDDDLYSTGFYDYLDASGIIFCEWCEKCPWAIPADAIKVKIEKILTDGIFEASRRKITIGE